MVHEVQGVISRSKEAPVELTTILVPDPGPGEARVRHKAVGLNYLDTYQRGGLYKIALPSGIFGSRPSESERSAR